VNIRIRFKDTQVSAALTRQPGCQAFNFNDMQTVTVSPH
jgi:hypothetical protein